MSEQSEARKSAREAGKAIDAKVAEISASIRRTCLDAETKEDAWAEIDAKYTKDLEGPWLAETFARVWKSVQVLR